VKESFRRKPETKKDAKQRHLRAAASRVFSRKGYNGTSIRDITDEADVSVGSFYSYFETKEDIIGKLYDELAAKTLQIAVKVSSQEGDSSAKKFTRAMTHAICVYVKNKELSRIIFSKCTGINDSLEKRRAEILEKTRQYLAGVLGHLSAAHSLPMDDTDVLSVALTQSIFGFLSYWLDGKLAGDLEEAIRALSEYHLRALRIGFQDKSIRRYIHEIVAEELKDPSN